jgi:asparagine synthase (glutamine-hydrolysing)
MAASLEARSPLLDHKLAEFMVSIPDHYRIRRGRLKALLIDAYRGCIPDEVLDGSKKGFEIPLNSWLEVDVRELIIDTLLSSSARVCDYLEASFVRDLLNKKVHKESNWAYIVYALLILELWLRENA